MNAWYRIHPDLLFTFFSLSVSFCSVRFVCVLHLKTCAYFLYVDTMYESTRTKKPLALSRSFFSLGLYIVQFRAHFEGNTVRDGFVLFLQFDSLPCWQYDSVDSLMCDQVDGYW